jgi:hypothetical protein
MVESLSMRKIFAILLVIAILFATPLAVDAAKKPVPTKKVVKQVKKIAPKKPVKKVLGAKKSPVVSFISSLVSCAMPDGKTIKASKKDCDFVTSFWSKNKPSNPGPSNSGGSSNGGSTSGNSGHSNGPKTPHVSGAHVLACTSSSCGSITTVWSSSNTRRN